MLDVRKLFLLRDLALLGTITAVARARSYSPAAVSQQLSALERETKARLLERTGKRTMLTPLGRALVAHADRILAELERADATLASGQGELTGVVRIAAFPSAARVVMPAALVRLSTAHPRLDLQMTEMQPVLSLPRLRAGEFDVVLTHDYDLAPHDLASDLETTLLHTEPLLLARSADIPEPSSVVDLATVWWVADQPGSDCREVLIRVCGEAGFEPRVRHHTNDFAVALALVDAGHGVALVPGLAAGAPPENTRLSEVPGRPLRRQITAASRRGTTDNPVVRAVITTFREVFERLPESRPDSVTGV